MAWRSVVRQVLIEIVAVVVAISVSFGLSGVVVGLEGLSVRENVRSAASSVQSDNLGSLVQSVERLRANTRVLAAYTSSPAWLLAQYVPAVGEPVHAASTILSGANDVSNAAGGFLKIAQTLIEAGGKSDGRVLPEEVLYELGPAATQLVGALDLLREQLKSVDVNFAFGPAQQAAQSALRQAELLLPEVIVLLRALPAIAVLLGSQAPQTWFVAFQNGGESRGTGGLVGSFATVKLHQGKVETTKVGSNEELTAKADPAVLPPASQKLWGPDRLAEVFGVNFSPNFPYAGELLSSLWKRQSGLAPDAVLALDQRATTALISAVGPIEVDGITVTGDNAFELLTIGVYQRFPDSTLKDAFIAKLINQVMQRITSGAASSMKLAMTLANEVLDRHMFLWAQDAGLQESLAPTVFAGVVPDKNGPFAMAVVNNNAGNKMDTFLHTSVRYKGQQCIVGGRRGSVSVELFNNPPTKPLPDYVGSRGDRSILWGLSSAGDGSNRVRVAVYLPNGAYVDKAVPNQLYVGEERGHPVAMFGVELARGERKTITVDFTEFGGADLLNKAPTVLAQPMLNAQEISVEPGPQC